MKNKMNEKDCDKCKYTDTKSSRYPCSECSEFTLDKWEDPNKEDFDHENRIYTLEGHNKAFEEEFFKWKDEMESKYNNLSGQITEIKNDIKTILTTINTHSHIDIKEKLEDIRTIVNYNHEHGLPAGYFLRWIAPLDVKKIK